VGEVLRVPDDPLNHHDTEQDPPRLLDAGRGVGLPQHVQDDQQEDGGHPHGLGVGPGHIGQADGDPLGAFAAGVGPGPGGGGAGRHGHGQQDEIRPGEQQRAPGHGQRPPAGAMGGPKAQHNGHRQEGDPHHEVGHDHVGVELGVDDDATEYGLGQHTEDEASGQPPQVPTGRCPEEGGHVGHSAGHHQDQDHHPVAELDPRVEGRRGRQLLSGAGGPIRAAQAGVGQADGRTGGHVEHDGRQGDPRQEEETTGAESRGGHRPSMVSARPSPGPPGYGGSGVDPDPDRIGGWG
jgi:hypothetical protein